MKFDAVFVLFAASLAGIAVLHNIAMESALYWLYPWFDIPMHFSGGLVAGLGFLALRPPFVPRGVQTLSGTLAFVLAVGLAWEVFEWAFRLVETIRYVPDTVGDVACDLLGGVAAYAIAHVLRRVNG